MSFRQWLAGSFAFMVLIAMLAEYADMAGLDGIAGALRALL